VLKIEGLSVFYDGLCALQTVSLEINTGEFVAVVGPNGAGKTTLFKAISGVVPISSGTMHYNGTDLALNQAHLRASLGIRESSDGCTNHFSA
jgi:branched-chain amino acid transport system ATP-binding protein